MNKKLAIEILELLDIFNEPIAKLEEMLSRIQDEKERKKLRRALGELMALLECDIAQPLRGFSKENDV